MGRAGARMFARQWMGGAVCALALAGCITCAAQAPAADLSLAGFEPLAALLGMLNSCGSGVTVVNIDNGFGAACAADDILSLAAA